MAPQVFEGITPDRYERMKSAASKAGLPIDGDRGKRSMRTPLGDVQFAYSYDRDRQSLAITCLKKPFLVTEAKITSTIQGLVTSAA